MSSRWGTRDWYLMHYSTPSITGGQKHTHTYSSLIDDEEILQYFLNLPRLVFSTRRKRKDQRNAGNVLQTHTLQHIMETIIFVIPMLNSLSGMDGHDHPLKN